ncbi:hypothetical protein [Longispora urticae]
MSRLLRTALAATFTLAATGVSLAVTAPAQAAPPCRVAYFLTDGGTAIGAEAWMICYDGQPERQIYVSLQRLNPGTGTWTTVSSYWETTTYMCVGTATNTYRSINDTTNVVRTITANCG